METTRTSSPYFSPNSASAPGLHRLVGRHQPRDDLGIVADAAIHLGLDGGEILGRGQAFGWLKSKRSRSGATSEPFWVT